MRKGDIVEILNLTTEDLRGIVSCTNGLERNGERFVGMRYYVKSVYKGLVWLECWFDFPLSKFQLMAITKYNSAKVPSEPGQEDTFTK